MSDDFPTFDEIHTPKRKMLERDIQSACIRWARGRDWWCRKFQSPANRAVPDYILGKDGFTLFVEFKKPGGKPTAQQQEEHNAMLAARLVVHVIDDVDTFKKLVLMWERQMAQMEKQLT